MDPRFGVHTKVFLRFSPSMSPYSAVNMTFDYFRRKLIATAICLISCLWIFYMVPKKFVRCKPCKNQYNISDNLIP